MSSDQKYNKDDIPKSVGLNYEMHPSVTDLLKFKIIQELRSLVT